MLAMKETYTEITIEELAKLTLAMGKKPVTIACDLETTGLNARTDKIVSVALGTLNNVYILDFRPFYALPEYEKEHWKKTLVAFFQEVPLIVTQNGKFDTKFMRYHTGARLEPIVDIMVQELVIYGKGSSGADREGLETNLAAMGERYGFPVHKELRNWFIGLDTREEWKHPFPPEQLEYMVQDIIVPLKIYGIQAGELANLELTQVAELEHLCLPVVAKMELDGSYVDKERWLGIIEKKQAERDRLEAELQQELTPYVHAYREEAYTLDNTDFQDWVESYGLTLKEVQAEYPTYVTTEMEQGRVALGWGKYKIAELKKFRESYPRPKKPTMDTSPINLGSPLQLSIALEGLGIYTESTDEAHLAPYKVRYPVVAKILEWRDVDHFLNSFGLKLLARIEDDGRIHPTYNQLGAATGRFSCSKPNWQQLPSHEPDDTSVRKCIIGGKGNVLLTADFSNIELRILAEISQDENMLRLFADGKDLHSMTAINMFGLAVKTPGELEELAREDTKVAGMLKEGLEPYDITARLLSPFKRTWRDIAKTINFGLVYGMSPIALGHTIGVDKEEAEKLFTAYFEAYPGVHNWLETSSKLALEQGFSKTLAGRKRFYNVPLEPNFDSDTMEWQYFVTVKSHYWRMVGRYGRQAKNAPIQGSNADILKYALALLYRKLPEHVKFSACVHDEIVLECRKEEKDSIAHILSACMTKACKRYLKTVTVPDVKVTIAAYWSK